VRARLGLLLTICCWATLFVDVCVALTLRFADRYSLPTLFAYGPRWVWIVPPLLLLPAAIFAVRRSLPLLGAITVSLWFVMQCEVNLTGRRAPIQPLTIVSFNAEGQRDVGTFAAFVREVHADVVALQEWDEEVGPNALPGLTIQCAGDICIGARFPMSMRIALDRRSMGRHVPMVVGTEVSAPIGRFSFFSVHLETVRRGVEPVLDHDATGLSRMRRNARTRDLESRAASEWIGRASAPAIVAGDFNLTTDSAIYRTHWSGWSNAFESAGRGFGYTKFTSWWGVRIDHVLFDGHWAAISARTGPDMGSDHRPVVVVLERRESD
jgi:endonuclease/exonuclease/phosphatase family metal-dependent hydrolase